MIENSIQNGQYPVNLLYIYAIYIAKPGLDAFFPSISVSPIENTFCKLRWRRYFTQSTSIGPLTAVKEKSLCRNRM